MGVFTSIGILIICVFGIYFCSMLLWNFGKMLLEAFKELKEKSQDGKKNKR